MAGYDYKGLTPDGSPTGTRGEQLSPEAYNAKYVQGSGVQDLTRTALQNYVTSRDTARGGTTAQDRFYGLSSGNKAYDEARNYEGAGFGVFGHDYARGALNDQAAMEEFQPYKNESESQWLSRMDTHFAGFSHAYKQGNLSGNSDVRDYFNFSKKDANGETPEQKRLREENEAQTKTRKEIEDFTKELAAPLTLDSPDVQRVMSMVGTNASNAARARGVQGPASVQGIAESQLSGLGSLNADRKGQYFQALQYKNADQLQQGQLKNANAQQDWENRMGLTELRRQKDPGGTIAGLAGAGIGVIGGAVTGNYAAIPSLASAGYSIGKGGYEGLAGGGGNYPAPPKSYGGM